MTRALKSILIIAIDLAMIAVLVFMLACFIDINLSNLVDRSAADWNLLVKLLLSGS